jgi:hypothetical protein
MVVVFFFYCRQYCSHSHRQFFVEQIEKTNRVAIGILLYKQMSI